MGSTRELRGIRIAAVLALAVSPGTARPQPVSGGAERAYRVLQGTVWIEFDRQSLGTLGWRLGATERSQQVSSQYEFTLPIETSSTLRILNGYGESGEILAGTLQTRGGVVLEDSTGSIPIEQLAIELAPDDVWKVTRSLYQGEISPTPFELAEVEMDLELPTGELRMAGELVVAGPWAHYLGIAESAGTVVGTLLLEARIEENSAATPEQDIACSDARLPQARNAAGNIGPDLLSADLFSPRLWWCDPLGAVDINAYSIGTAVCNVGDFWVNWFLNSSDHPVVAQNMYRFEGGRFEQIGMSWAKHIVFSPSNTTICGEPGECEFDPTGQHLGVGCSDASSSTVNGAQNILAPRDQVNAATGEVLWTGPDIGTWPAIDRRLQVHNADLDPDLNAGALYYIEGQHIAADDAAAGNDDNNASYRSATVSEVSENCYQLTPTLRTVRGMPAILAWQDRDPLVNIEYVDVPGDGRFILGSRMTTLGDGMWHYEYALQNLNSDRSGQYLSVPLASGVTFSNVDFHDVDYHSGSIYSTADWTVNIDDVNITWATETVAQNPDANALRWGTLYNYRFDAQICPVSGSATLGLFKPGDPASITIPTQVPGEAIAMISSNPPDGAIDARQPLDPADSSTTGWQHLDLTFTNCASSISDTDFLVEQNGGSGSAPDVDGVDPIDAVAIALTLSSPISVGAWTNIRHDPSGTSTQVGYLPADVDGSGASDTADAAAWIDAVSGVDDPLPIWSTDINRSSSPDSEDLLRVMDLLSGAGDFESYMGASLP